MGNKLHFNKKNFNVIFVLFSVMKQSIEIDFFFKKHIFTRNGNPNSDSIGKVNYWTTYMSSDCIRIRTWVQLMGIKMMPQVYRDCYPNPHQLGIEPLIPKKKF